MDMNYVYIRHNAVPIPLLLLFSELVTKSTRYVALVEQDLPTLPEHLSSFDIFYDRTRKKGDLFNTGDCLIEMIAWVGLTVYYLTE
jgi:hypothetical protein